MDSLSVICGGIAAILSIIASLKWKDLKLIGKIAILFSIVALIIGSVVAYKKNKKEKLIEKINASYGNINDMQNGQIPFLGFGSKEGSAKIGFDFSGTLRLGGKNLLKAHIKNNKLYVSIVIKDSLNNPILAIYNNEWTKYQNTYEFNNDDNAIELVTKGDRTVFFHLLLRKGVVYIEGTLYTGVEEGFNFFSETKWDGFQIIGPGVSPRNDSIQRLFKYPRERYLGVREEYH